MRVVGAQPKLKAGKLLLEIGEPAEWTQYEIVLAGSNIGDLGLYYYANKTDEAPQGCIYLHSAHIDVLEVQNHALVLGTRELQPVSNSLVHLTA